MDATRMDERPGPPAGGERPLRGLPGGRARRRPRPPGGESQPGKQRATGGEARPLRVLPGGTERRLRALPGEAGSPGGRSWRAPFRRDRRRLLAAAVIAAALLAVAVVTARTPGGTERRPAQSAPAATAPAQPPVVSPPSPVVATVGIGGFPYGLTFGGGSLWVARSDRVTRIDPAANRVAATVPVGTAGSGPAAVASGAGAVWAPVAVPGTLWRVDPDSNRVTARIPLGGPLRGDISVSATRGAVWVACCGRQSGENEQAGTLLRVDPRRQRVVAEIPLAANPTAVAATPDAVWVATADGRVLVVDPKRNRVADSVDAGGPSLGFTQTITVGAGGVWLAEPLAEQVVRIDPRTGRVVARIPAGAATTVAVGEGGVWVLSSLGVLRIDPDHNRVVATVAAAELRRAMVVTTGGGAVWAAGWSSVARIDPRRVRD